MKITNGLFLLCCSLSAVLGAPPEEEEQHPIKYGIVFPTEESFRAIKSEGIDYDKATGEIKIALSTIESAVKLKQTGMFVHGSESSQYNRLRVFSFKPDLDFSAIVEEPYSMEGGRFSGIDTKPLSEIVQNYPAYFEQPALKSFIRSVKNSYGVENQTIVFDESINDFVPASPREAVMIGRKAPTPALDSSLNFCVDETNQSVTTYFGKKLAEKFSNQKYLVFATYDLNGNLRNTFEVTFPFPRAMKTSLVVRSRTKPSEAVGTVFIFERQMFFGKQFSDPEKNNYEIVVCDPQGKLLLYKTCKIGDAKRSGFEPYCMLADGDKFQLFGHFMNTKGEGLIVTTLSADGSETSTEILMPAIKLKRVNEKNPIGHTRPFDKLGVTFEAFERFSPMGHMIASNGDLLIWGRAVTDVDDPNYKPGTQPGSSFGHKVTQYRDLACFQFNPANELVALYGALLEDTLEPGPITLTSVNEKIIFSIAEPKRPISEVEGRLLSTPSLSTPGRTQEYSFKQLFRPKFVVLTPGTTKMATHVPTNGRLTLINPQKFSVAVAEKSTVYYFGYSINRKEPEMRVWVDSFAF